MKSIFIGAILLFGLSSNTVKAEDGSKEIKFLKTEVDSLKNQQERLHDEIKTLSLRKISTELLMLIQKEKILINSVILPQWKKLKKMIIT